MASSLMKKWIAILNSGSLRVFGDFGLLVMRIGFGLAMITHGYAKLTRFSEISEQFPGIIPLLGPSGNLALAVFAELFCSIALIAGLFTRLALTQLIATMVVAAFIVHAQDDFGTKEKALLYLTGYVGLLLTGPGRFSLDYIIVGRMARRIEAGS